MDATATLKMGPQYHAEASLATPVPSSNGYAIWQSGCCRVCDDGDVAATSAHGYILAEIKSREYISCSRDASNRDGRRHNKSSENVRKAPLTVTGVSPSLELEEECAFGEQSQPPRRHKKQVRRHSETSGSHRGSSEYNPRR